MTTSHSKRALRPSARITVGIAVIAVAAIFFQMAELAASQQATNSEGAAPKTWSNVMYLGGAAGVRGKSLDWGNRLTVSREAITFKGTGKSPIQFEIPTASVRTLDYSGHKHANDGATTAGFIAGGLAGALLGSSAKSVDHYVILEYQLLDGTPSAILLRLHKDNQQEIIAALRALIPLTEPVP